MPSPTDWLLGFAPGLVWLAYFQRKDRHEPEPRRKVLTIYALGSLAALAVVELRPLLERLLPGEAQPWHGVIDAFAVTALTEELLKLGALLAAWHGREWDEPLDGIVYGAAAAQGFASVESAFYLALSGEAGVVLVRAFTATLLHVGCSGGIGFVVGWAHLHRGASRLVWTPLALALAVLVHGAWDLVLVAHPEWSVVALLLLLPALLVALGSALRWSRARSPEYHPAAEARRGSRAA